MMEQVKNSGAFGKHLRNWNDILKLLNEPDNYLIRRSICVSCGKGALYDNNGNRHEIHAKQTLEEVKLKIQIIKDINSHMALQQ